MTTPTTPRPAPPCRPLGEYVSALVHRLGMRESELLARLRRVVGARRARITLDDETVEVAFDRGTLAVTPPGNGTVDGEGATDRPTTLDLLDGRLELTAALLEGRLRATGEIENLARIFQAIEILLDGAARNPGLQGLALDYREDPCRPAPPPLPRPAPASPSFLIDPDHVPAGQRELLRRLDLLP